MFSATHIIHEIIESFGDQMNESKQHHGTAKLASVVVIISLIRLGIYGTYLTSH